MRTERRATVFRKNASRPKKDKAGKVQTRVGSLPQWVKDEDYVSNAAIWWQK